MAFENFEVWFVTGAQLLYGGDAVVAVDAHSNEMVKGLNESGNLPEESSKEIMLSVVELENYSNTVLVFEVCMHCSASFEMPW